MTDTKEMVKVNNKSGWDEALENESWIAPMVNIYETNDNFNLTAYLPEVERENVKVKIEDNSLIIMGRINYDDAVNRNYLLNEFTVGNFYRKFNLSETVDTEKIEARFENGILKLQLPKHERIKPKIIEIN